MSLANIMVAPNGAYKTSKDHAQLPVTVEQTIHTAKACFEAGAQALHAHIRDAQQQHVLDKGFYRELQRGMAEQVPKMQVQITTEAGGRYDAAFQRQFISTLEPSYLSLSYAEMQRDTKPSDVLAFYRELVASPMQVQHIFYSAQQLQDFTDFIWPLIKHAGTESEHQALFVLGRYHAQQQSQASDIQPFLQVHQQAQLSLPWAVCAFGQAQVSCLIAANQAGGNMRIGFENSLLTANGDTARDNAAQVKELAELI